MTDVGLFVYISRETPVSVKCDQTTLTVQMQQMRWEFQCLIKDFFQALTIICVVTNIEYHFSRFLLNKPHCICFYTETKSRCDCLYTTDGCVVN